MDSGRDRRRSRERSPRRRSRDTSGSRGDSRRRRSRDRSRGRSRDERRNGHRRDSRDDSRRRDSRDGRRRSGSRDGWRRRSGRRSPSPHKRWQRSPSPRTRRRSLARSPPPPLPPPPADRMPDFLIVGAQKAGTTSVVANLNKHPDVFVANELHFFDLYYEFGDEWYTSKLRTNKRLIGEKTPELIYCDACLPRIKEKCPNAKFLLFLREPTSRAYSAWNMETNRQNEMLSFSECVERELQHSMGEIRTFGTSQVHYIQRGFYMDQIERFLQVFDRSQLLVMVTERMAKDIEGAYKTIFEFLGVPYVEFEKDVEHVGSYRKKIPKRTYKKLREIFQPHNQRLYEFLGGPIEEWEDDGQEP